MLLSRSIAEIEDLLNKNNLGFATNALSHISHLPGAIVRYAKIDEIVLNICRK